MEKLISDHLFDFRPPKISDHLSDICPKNLCPNVTPTYVRCDFPNLSACLSIHLSKSKNLTEITNSKIWAVIPPSFVSFEIPDSVVANCRVSNSVLVSDSWKYRWIWDSISLVCRMTLN